MADAIRIEEATEVFDGLASLVDKSLVQVEAAPGDARFKLLETIREYTAEQLAGRGDGHLAQRQPQLAHVHVPGRRIGYEIGVDGGIEPLGPYLEADKDFASKLTDLTPVKWRGEPLMLNWYIKVAGVGEKSVVRLKDMQCSYSGR